MNKPDPLICKWWDWQQPNGKVVRICYANRFRINEESIKTDLLGREIKTIDKTNYCWESIGSAYTQEGIDFIGGKFEPIPLTEF